MASKLDEETPSLTAEDRHQRSLALDNLVIGHPRLGMLEELIQALIEDTDRTIKLNDEERDKAAKRRVKPALEHLWHVPVIGPSGATKTKTLKLIQASINAKAPDGKAPVAYISIPETIRSTKSLYSEIFRVFEDHNNKDNLDAALSVPNAHEIEEAIIAVVRPRGTRVVILDEAHNLLVHDAGKLRIAMAQALKSLLNESVFSLVLAGTNDADPLFQGELAGRVYKDFDLGRLRIEREEDRSYFFTFVKKYENRLVKDGVLDAKFGLTEDRRTRAQIYEAADGVVGIVPRILKIAIREAFSKGRTLLEVDDLAEATWTYWRRQDPDKKNPFVDGPDDKVLKWIKAASEKQPA